MDDAVEHSEINEVKTGIENLVNSMEGEIDESHKKIADYNNYLTAISKELFNLRNLASLLYGCPCLQCFDNTRACLVRDLRHIYDPYVKIKSRRDIHSLEKIEMIVHLGGYEELEEVYLCGEILNFL